MAHECPECGQVCYCGGDIDDCVFNGTKEEARCTHCICSKCGEEEEWCCCPCPDCGEPNHSCYCHYDDE